MAKKETIFGVVRDRIVDALNKNKIPCSKIGTGARVEIFGSPRFVPTEDGNGIILRFLVDSDGFGRKSWDEMVFTWGEIADPDTDVQKVIDKCVDFITKYNSLLNGIGRKTPTLKPIVGGPAKKVVIEALKRLGIAFDKVTSSNGTITIDYSSNKWRHIHEDILEDLDGKILVGYKSEEENLKPLDDYLKESEWVE